MQQAPRTFALEPAEAGLVRRGEPVLGWACLAVLGGLCALIAPAMLVYLLGRGLGLLAGDAATTLWSADWYPRNGVFGLLPLVGGTAVVSILGLAVAVPLGLGTALTLAFFVRGRVQHLGETALGVLGGIPSVVFGLFGTFWFLPLLGPSVASAALVLGAMLVPTFALLALAAFRQLPDGLLRDGQRLGLTRDQAIWRLGLRAARPALLGAAVLSLARGLGEALAVEMVCGNVPGLPTSVLDPVRTLTTTLVQEFEYAEGAHGQALHLVALVVVLLAVVVSFVSLRVQQERRA